MSHARTNLYAQLPKWTRDYLRELSGNETKVYNALVILAPPKKSTDTTTLRLETTSTRVHDVCGVWDSDVRKILHALSKWTETRPAFIAYEPAKNQHARASIVIYRDLPLKADHDKLCPESNPPGKPPPRPESRTPSKPPGPESQAPDTTPSNTPSTPPVSCDDVAPLKTRDSPENSAWEKVPIGASVVRSNEGRTRPPGAQEAEDALSMYSGLVDENESRLLDELYRANPRESVDAALQAALNAGHFDVAAVAGSLSRLVGTHAG